MGKDDDVPHKTRNSTGSLATSTIQPHLSPPDTEGGGIQELESSVGHLSSAISINKRGEKDKPPPKSKKKYGESPVTKESDHGKLAHILEVSYHLQKDVIALIPSGFGVSFFSKASEAVINSWTDSPSARILLSIAVEQIKEDLSARMVPPSSSSSSSNLFRVDNLNVSPGDQPVPLQAAGIPPQAPILANTAATANGDPYEFDEEFSSVVGKAIIFSLMGSVEKGVTDRDQETSVYPERESRSKRFICYSYQ